MSNEKVWLIIGAGSGIGAGTSKAALPAGDSAAARGVRRPQGDGYSFMRSTRCGGEACRGSVATR